MPLILPVTADMLAWLPLAPIADVPVCVARAHVISSNVEGSSRALVIRSHAWRECDERAATRGESSPLSRVFFSRGSRPDARCFNGCRAGCDADYAGDARSRSEDRRPVLNA